MPAHDARYLLDTCVVSMPIAKQPNEAVVRRLVSASGKCAISAQVWQELSYGASRLPASKRKRLIDDYLKEVVKPSFPILPYDETAAEWHGRERARLEKRGTPKLIVNTEIAAVAVAHDLTLATLNVRDFRGFRGLRIEDWSQ